MAFLGWRWHGARTDLPDQLCGHVSSIDFLGSSWMIPLPMAITGPVAQLFGPRTELVGLAWAEPALSC